MKSLIENTSLHSLIKDFSENKFSVDNRNNFFQFCNLLIYYDKIYIDCYRDEPEVTNNTYEYHSLLSRYGTKSIFNTNEFKDYTYNKIFKQTSNLLKENFDTISFSMKDLNPRIIFPKGINQDFYDSVVLLKSIILENDRNRISNILNEFKESKKGDLTNYIVLSNVELKEKMSNMIIEFNQNELLKFNAIIRSFINYEISNELNANLSPSEGRANLLEASNFNIANKINNVLDSYLAEITNVEIKYPSTTYFLLEKSKYEPKRMLEIALDTRNKAKRLRKKIKKLNDGESFNRLEFNDILNELKSNIGLSKRNNPIIDELKMSFYLGFIPKLDFKLSPATIKSRIDNYRIKKRYLFLHNIVNYNINRLEGIKT